MLEKTHVQFMDVVRGRGDRLNLDPQGGLTEVEMFSGLIWNGELDWS